MKISGLTIISGGQTGADRAALDWAIANNVPHGGWCPEGRKAEDGPIPARYQLLETPRADYLQRTEWNVRDSDLTVIFTLAPRLSGGSRKTVEFARKHGKPVCHLAASDTENDHARALRAVIKSYHATRLNVAGPRASKEPGVAAFVQTVLDQTFGSAQYPRTTLVDPRGKT